MYQTCQFPIFHNANLPLPEMLYCISESVGLQINILLMCIKLVGRIAYYHRGHIAFKHGSDWNIPMSEFHLAHSKLKDEETIDTCTYLGNKGLGAAHGRLSRRNSY